MLCRAVQAFKHKAGVFTLRLGREFARMAKELWGEYKVIV